MDCIRVGTLADLPALVALEQVCFPADRWGEAGILSHLQSPVCATLLYVIEEQVVGALLTQNIHPEFEVLRISTHPANRQQGVAKALLSAHTEAVRRQGYTKGFLEVRESNTPARTFYQNAGYLPTGRRKHYYQNPVEDAILMEILLAQ